MSTTSKDLFAQRYPCMYHGKIICKDCEIYEDCDLAAGRELHEHYFIDGFDQGVLNTKLRILK